MKIVVLIKQVPDTYEDRKLDLTTGWVDRAASERVVEEITERALEVALQQKDADKSTDVVVMSMGPAELTPALRRCLAMGADSAVHVLDDALRGADALHTATVLAAALATTGYDLIITGNESTDGRGGIVPAMIAEKLGLPILSYMHSVNISADSVSGERGSESGSALVHSPLPAVVSVTERAAEARFPGFKGIMGAKKKPVVTLTLADLAIGDDTFASAGRSVVVSTKQKPARSAGTVITDDGSGAEQLADFLAAGRLI